METKCIAVKVGKPLWKAISVAAMEDEKTLQDLIVPVLEKEFGGLVQKEPSVKQKQPSKASVVVGCGLVGVEPPKPISAVSEPSKPTPEEVEKKQRSCKHYFLGGKGGCVKCGWVPPVAY